MEGTPLPQPPIVFDEEVSLVDVEIRVYVLIQLDRAHILRTRQTRRKNQSESGSAKGRWASWRDGDSMYCCAG